MEENYTVKYTFDGTWWVADCVDIEGCSTQGRTVDEARERIREAIACAMDWPGVEKYTGKITDEIQEP